MNKIGNSKTFEHEVHIDKKGNEYFKPKEVIVFKNYKEYDLHFDMDTSLNKETLFKLIKQLKNMIRGNK